MKIYKNKEKNNENDDKSCWKSIKSILKSILFLIIFMSTCIISIVTIIVSNPEPTVNKITEKYQGWDGFMLNLRNIFSLAELEYNIIYFYFQSVLISGYYLYWCKYICFCFKGSGNLRRILRFYEIGKLTKKNQEFEKNIKDGKVSDIDLALEDLKNERRECIKENLIKRLENPKFCYFFIIPKFCFDIIYGIILSIIMICLTYFEVHNTFRDNTMNDYSKIKSESEKGEISENIKKGLNSDLLMFFFASYFYYLAMFYSSFKRNYFKEYLPFLGGDYNGIAFIILKTHNSCAFFSFFSIYK